MARTLPEVANLRLLVGIAEHGSLGAAARAVDMAQPNATRALARLERQLGLSLVVRSPAGSKLTTEGTLIVQWARQVLDATEQLVLGAEALRSQGSGHLDVAASMTVSEYLVPAWLGEFRRRRPEVALNLQVHNSADVFDLIRTRACRLGFVESPAVPRDLRSAVVGRDELVVVVSPDHPWARRRRPLDAAELAATPLIVRESGSGTRVTLERVLRAVEMPRPVMELNSNAAVRIAVAAGVGPAVLSGLAVASSVERGELHQVPVDSLRLNRTLRAVWASTADLGDNGAELLAIARASVPRASVRGSRPSGRSPR